MKLHDVVMNELNDGMYSTPPYTAAIERDWRDRGAATGGASYYRRAY